MLTQLSLAGDSGTPVSIVFSTGGQGRLAISLAESLGANLGPSSAGTIKEDGTLRFQGLSTTAYLLNVNNPPEGTYVKSVKFGDRDVTHAPLDLGAGNGKLSIVLSSKAADVSGAAKNEKGEPIGGAIITLWPKTPDLGSMTGGVKQAYADQNGAFKFTGLAPGEYYLAAWDELEPGLWQAADFLIHFNRDASLIKLDESAHATLDPKLIPPARLAAEMEKLP